MKEREMENREPERWKISENDKKEKSKEKQSQRGKRGKQRHAAEKSLESGGSGTEEFLFRHSERGTKRRSCSSGEADLSSLTGSH